MRNKIFLCAILVGFAACKKHHDSNSASSPEIIPSKELSMIAGTYGGNYTVTQMPSGDLHAVINQTGQTISGTYYGLNNEFSGTFTGMAGTDAFSFTATQTVPCAGTFTGQGTVNGKTLTANLSGSNCVASGTQTGSFTITQP